jgi:demethylmenaquinone methyltransferase/2-methoxy-6-polyprenyl-1,4-benzoquinol methylase
MNNILPIERSKTQARTYYDRISRFYDRLTSSEAGLIKQGTQLLAVQPDEKLLEIGCATGRALRFFTDTLNGDGVRVGLDLSRKMLVCCQAKKIIPAPHLIQGDGALLPLQAKYFHAVFMAFTLELFSQQDIQIVLSECYRVLKPDGRLGVVALGSDPRTFGVRLYELAHRLFPVAVDCRPIPLPALLETNGFQLMYAEKDINWGLPIHITVSTKRISQKLQKLNRIRTQDARIAGS